MKCPLLAIAWSGVVAKQQEDYPDCIKEECAWWDNEYNLCCVNRLSAGLAEMVALLNGIEAKMPHEAQFRK